MSTRTELPWSSITTEIIHVIDTCNEQRKFVNVRNITNHAIQNRDDYPELFQRVKNPTMRKAMAIRIATALGKAGWPLFSKHRCGSVFVDPRYRD